MLYFFIVYKIHLFEALYLQITLYSNLLKVHLLFIL